MMRAFLPVVPVAAALVASAFMLGCGGGAENSNDSTPQRASHTVVLRTGQPVVVGQEALTLQLTEVRDSRCPIEAVCVWAGHASASVLVSPAGQPAQTVVIGLPAPAGSNLPGDASVSGWRLALQAVDPAPRAGVAVPQDQYRATVLVERAQ